MRWAGPTAVLLGATLLPSVPALRHGERGGRRSSLEVKPSTEIKVIGAGSTRTGTQTMRRALEILGFNAAHEELVFNKTVRQRWLDWQRGGPFEPALQTLFDNGIDATTGDDPWGSAYKELLERYPRAKVILTNHPRGAEGWMKSVEKAVSRPLVDYVVGHKNIFADYWSYVFEGCMLIRGCPVNETLTDEIRRKCMRSYSDNVEEVKRFVPFDQLLDYTVSEGWDPLVKFLGVPKPRVPFPKVDAMPLIADGQFSVYADDWDDQAFMKPGNGYY